MCTTSAVYLHKHRDIEVLYMYTYVYVKNTNVQSAHIFKHYVHIKEYKNSIQICIEFPTKEGIQPINYMAVGQYSIPCIQAVYIQSRK